MNPPTTADLLEQLGKKLHACELTRHDQEAMGTPEDVEALALAARALTRAQELRDGARVLQFHEVERTTGEPVAGAEVTVMVLDVGDQQLRLLVVENDDITPETCQALSDRLTDQNHVGVVIGTPAGSNVRVLEERP